jgi:hypothetical protein
MFQIVKALGGEIYEGGRKALIPGPGHSAADRSISLILSSNGKVRAHAFSDHSWQEVLDWLQALNLVDRHHHLIDKPAVRAMSYRRALTDEDKTSAARRLWDTAKPIAGTLSATWLIRRRKIVRSLESNAFRHNPSAPLMAYDPKCPYARPAFVARVTSATGAHVGTEITYLDARGRKDGALRIPRKLIGKKPPGSAVEIDQVDTEMVVAEGVPSALSASHYFDLPCYALLGVKSFPSWRPPERVTSVIIACDRGEAGERYSSLLCAALARSGIRSRLEFPPNGKEDFNAYAGGYG